MREFKMSVDMKHARQDIKQECRKRLSQWQKNFWKN